MIKKGDIKIGLEFVLPFREEEYEEEVARFRHRLIMGEDCPVLPRYKTDLETLDGFTTIVTAQRPIFKVVDSPRGYFDTSSEPRYLGNFVKVACDKIKDEVLYLSTKDFVEHGKILDREKKKQ